MDAAKILGVTLSSNLNRPLNQIFRNGRQNIWASRLPVVCAPTTSGTGAEVTPFATAWDLSDNKKRSVAGDEIYPTIALLDAELTVSLPRDETLYTALDAISHALESLWNKNRTPTSEAFAIQSLALAVETLPLVLREPGNLEKRSQMQQASMLAGLAISQTRTAIAHSISYPLTIHFGVPHGLACSFTLRELLNRNLEKIATSTYEKSILIQVLNLLKSLNLAKRVCEYVSLEGVLDLKDEMWAGGRADNFTGEIYQGLDELLKNSLETASQ
jgi:phosphonate metabolism-associated iron-containing alcohol dehydrogenase